MPVFCQVIRNGLVVIALTAESAKSTKAKHKVAMCALHSREPRPGHQWMLMWRRRTTSTAPATQASGFDYRPRSVLAVIVLLLWNQSESSTRQEVPSPFPYPPSSRSKIFHGFCFSDPKQDDFIIFSAISGDAV